MRVYDYREWPRECANWTHRSLGPMSVLFDDVSDNDMILLDRFEERRDLSFCYRRIEGDDRVPFDGIRCKTCGAHALCRAWGDFKNRRTNKWSHGSYVKVFPTCPLCGTKVNLAEYGLEDEHDG